MNSNKIISAIIVVVVLAGAWLWFSAPEESTDMTGDDSMMVEKDVTADVMMEETATPSDDVMMQADVMTGGDVMMESSAGTYAPYSEEALAAADGDIILFFKATWCPTCRALDSSITANLGSIPAGVTILEVNYDTATALKMKYGVTTQHTLVQVDSSGNQIAKWGGSLTLNAMLAELQ